MEQTQANTVFIDEHYEKNIFPVIKDGGKKFNWVAGIFSPFWLAYKGLWKTWFMYLLPCAIFQAILTAYNKQTLMLGLSVAMIVSIGQIANSTYYKTSQIEAIKSKGNILAGVGGLALYAATMFLTEFTLGFVSSILSRM